MADKKPSKQPIQDKQLQEFIKSGGRPNAEPDFNQILRKSVTPPKQNKPKH